MHYINGDGGIKNPKEKFKFVNLLTEKGKIRDSYHHKCYLRTSQHNIGSQWLGGREADIEGTVRV